MYHLESRLQRVDIQPMSRKACTQGTSSRQCGHKVSRVIPQAPCNQASLRRILPILDDFGWGYISDVFFAEGFIISPSIFDTSTTGTPVTDSLTYGIEFKSHALDTFTCQNSG